MKIDKSISTLLYQYDCVVVPELGGFVANYVPAKIQPIQNTLSPPSKGISFNKNLNKNDGLLANFIVQTKGVDYSSSCKIIEEYVAKINTDLKLKKKVLIDDIGTLFLDSENRIQFDPENSKNYLLESYGLTTFQKLPIKRITLEDKITKEFKDRTAPLVAVKEKNRNSKKLLVAAAITIPLIFAAIWIPSQYDLSDNINYANLNPFKPASKAIYLERETTAEFKKPEGSNFKEKLAEASEDQLAIEVSFIDGEEPVVVKLKNAIAPTKTVSTYVATNNVDLKYHIIGGCFSKKSNAKKLVRKLKKEGFNAWIVGQRKGLWTVSYNSFSTRRAAVDALADAKIHNSKAWILNQ
jgi:CCDC81-like prokaryotic HU domain 1/CCDC81-like prokaryotic HU domain 2/SPOR domain